jgi:hypothetical protein
MLIFTRSAEAAGVWTAKILKLLSRHSFPAPFQTASLDKLQCWKNSSFHPSIFLLPASDIQGNSAYA